MRVLVLVGMVVVFLCAYFTLYTFQNVVQEYAKCFADKVTISCDVKSVGINLVVGLFIVSCFGMIIVAVGYVLVKHALFPSGAWTP